MCNIDVEQGMVVIFTLFLKLSFVLLKVLFLLIFILQSNAEVFNSCLSTLTENQKEAMRVALSDQ